MKTLRANSRRLMIGAACILATATAAIAIVYTYKCHQCGLVLQFTVPGIKKCPNDGRTMVPE